jgi:hypothetical protein
MQRQTYLVMKDCDYPLQNQERLQKKNQGYLHRAS